MVLEHEIPSFVDWLPWALVRFLAAVALLTVAGVFIGFLVQAWRIGPVEAFYAVAKVFAAAVRDARDFSLRRVLAMSRLAIQESIRRRVLVVFAIFVLLLLFAGWFLDVRSDHPGRLYLSFVLTATNYLVLVLALFLSAFSLPADMKSRTIYTIVTKPVRPSEIVLGRIVGFSVVGTALLVLMGGISYVFVVRGLSHRHEVDTASVASNAENPETAQGQTSYDAHHRHTFTLNADGQGQTSVEMDHFHTVERVSDGNTVTYVVGPPQGSLQARVPVYGKLRFLDRQGNEGPGIDVGHEWSYRSYIEGGTLGEAIWRFEQITPDRFPEGLPLELTLRVFRTHKGDIERGVLGSIQVRNVDRGAKVRESAPQNFIVREFATDRQFIPRKLNAIGQDGSLREVDLFEDLVSNGALEIVVECAERGQYYGMAQADLYIRAADSAFSWNFAKGYLGIWIQMLLVTCFGVMFSTFLSGPVAMMATLGSVVLGFFGRFVVEVAEGVVMGGGPLESLIRIVTQKNVQIDLDIGKVAESIVKGFDTAFLFVLKIGATLLPNYSDYNLASYVAYGFNIQSGLMATQLVTALAYFLVVSGIGYFFLKTREVAA